MITIIIISRTDPTQLASGVCGGWWAGGRADVGGTRVTRFAHVENVTEFHHRRRRTYVRFGRRQPPLGYGSAAVTSCDARGSIRRPLYRPRRPSHARTPTEDPPPTPFTDNRCGGGPPHTQMDGGDLAPVHNTHTNARAPALIHTHILYPHTRTHTLGRWQVHTAAATGTKGPDSPEPLRRRRRRP